MLHKYSKKWDAVLGKAACVGFLLLCLVLFLIKGQASKVYLNFYFMCMGILLHIWLSTICIPSVYRDQKKTSSPLKLELQMVMSHYVGAGNWTQVIWRRSHFFLFCFSYMSYKVYWEVNKSLQPGRAQNELPGQVSWHSECDVLSPL